MSSEIAIKVENLSKCYQIYGQPRDRLKQFVLPLLQRFAGAPKQYYREFWAIKSLSFEVKKGETVGIIGRNGSGKSTLLQMICGTLSPTSGSVQTNGRIAALLELGSGFNPEFTGRENIYMNASILGLTKDEIDARFDVIASFADIGEFIERPAKTYSSGMMMRLAFAVAINVNPKILIVDEALSVGDAAFQEKCFRKINQLKSTGTTILFVTHDVTTISAFCDLAILINQGELVMMADANSIINEYKKIISSKPALISKDVPNKSCDLFGDNKNYYGLSKNYHRSGNGSAEIIDWLICDEEKKSPALYLNFGYYYQVVIYFSTKVHGLNLNIGFFFSDKKGLEITGAATHHEKISIYGFKEGEVGRVTFKFRMLIKPGVYFFNVGISEHTNDGVIAYDRHYSIFEVPVIGEKIVGGLVALPVQVDVKKI